MKNQQKLRSACEIDLKSQFATFDGIATKGDNAIVKRIVPFQGFQVMLDYDRMAIEALSAIDLPEEKKKHLRTYAELLSGRKK